MSSKTLQGGHMRNQTWFACVVCSVSVLPGLVLGALASFVVTFLNGMQVSPDTDFLFLKTLFGIEAPGIVINFIFFVLLPIGLQGAIAGSFAIWVTSKLALNAKYDVGAYITGALYTGAVLALAIVLFVVRPTSVATVGLIQEIARIVGLWLGLLGTAETFSAEQKRRAYLEGRKTATT
jgi:hypothetical protein